MEFQCICLHLAQVCGYIFFCHIKHRCTHCWQHIHHPFIYHLKVVYPTHVPYYTLSALITVITQLYSRSCTTSCTLIRCTLCTVQPLLQRRYEMITCSDKNAVSSLLYTLHCELWWWFSRVIPWDHQTKMAWLWSVIKIMMFELEIPWGSCNFLASTRQLYGDMPTMLVWTKVTWNIYNFIPLLPLLYYSMKEWSRTRTKYRVPIQRYPQIEN